MVFLYGFIFTLLISVLDLYTSKKYNSKLISFLFKNNSNLVFYLKSVLTPMILWMIVEKKVLINNQNSIPIKGYSFFTFIIIFIFFYFLITKILKVKNTKIILIFLYMSAMISYITTFLLINVINLSFIIKLIGIFLFILTISLYFISNIKIKKECL